VTRIKELQRGTFSQHAIETVCFDLRIRLAGAVTGQYAPELPEIQDESRSDNMKAIASDARILSIPGNR